MSTASAFQTMRYLAVGLCISVGCEASPLDANTAMAAQAPFPMDSYAGDIRFTCFPPSGQQAAQQFHGQVEIVRKRGAEKYRLRGKVFIDINRNSRLDRHEHGVAGVSVSNGYDVVTTDQDGDYNLPVRDPMVVSISIPSGFAAPMDDTNVPQFFYLYNPHGTASLSGGGISPTGPLPSAVNFPLYRRRLGNHFQAVISGETAVEQATASFVRDGFALALMRVSSSSSCPIAFTMITGDLVDDELEMYSRLKDWVRLSNVPQLQVPGNHDSDFDARSPTQHYDTFAQQIEPPYYSSNFGRVHLVVLNSSIYPIFRRSGQTTVKAEKAEVDQDQLHWLKADLARVPTGNLVVLVTHYPTVTAYRFAPSDAYAGIENAGELYGALGNHRNVLHIADHVLTTEYVERGEYYAGWPDLWRKGGPGVSLVNVGSAHGDDYNGTLQDDGTLDSLDGAGVPKGLWLFDFNGTRASAQFVRYDFDDAQMSLGFISPSFRKWEHDLSVAHDQEMAEGLKRFRANLGFSWGIKPQLPDPPLDISDLPDTSTIAIDELANSAIAANVWAASRDWKVDVSWDGGAPAPMHRTQQGKGEPLRRSLDPAALKIGYQVPRYAFVSSSGNPKTQGSRGAYGAPRWSFRLATTNVHLWTAAVPGSLGLGAHYATVRAVDKVEHVFTQSIPFEIVASRPPPFVQQGKE